MTLKISHYSCNAIAEEVFGLFGKSNGKTVSDRINFENFEEKKYSVSIATEKPFFLASRFIEREILIENQIKTVWININSFKKRFSGDSRAAVFLMNTLPGKFIPGLKVHLSTANSNNRFSHSDSNIFSDTHFLMGQRPVFDRNSSTDSNSTQIFQASRAPSSKDEADHTPHPRKEDSSPKDSSDSSASGSFSLSDVPLYDTASKGKDTDSKDKAPKDSGHRSVSDFFPKDAAPLHDLNPLKSLELTSTSSCSLDSTSSFQASRAAFSINPLIKGNRVDLIQDTIRRYSPLSYVSNIAKYCYIADLEASRLPPGTSAKIAAKNHYLDRSILIGPTGKFLLLTHVQKGQDYEIGNGAYKKAKLAVNLDTGQIKTVTIAKRSNLKQNRNWEIAKETLSNELEMTIQVGKNNKDVVHLDFGHQSNQTTNPETGKIISEEKHYFIMDYCDDGDLFDRKWGSSEFEQHQWTLEIARGLANMHQQGILHRDVKPGNIFLQKGHVKIGDLGFACTTKEAETNNRPGTAAYMAPECLNRRQTSIKSDAWSFGCVVFELFVRNKQRFCLNTSDEFKGDQVSVDQRIDRKDSKGNYLILNPECRKLLKGLLTLDPERRMTVEEFYEKFSQIPTPE